VISDSAYKLELLETIKWHLVFRLVLVSKADNNPFYTKIIPLSLPVTIYSHEECTLEEILHSQILYRIL
jgi:hypothetical protein